MTTRVKTQRFPFQDERFWVEGKQGVEENGVFLGMKKGVGRDLINFEGSSAPFVQGRERGRAGRRRRGEREGGVRLRERIRRRREAGGTDRPLD